MKIKKNIITSKIHIVPFERDKDNILKGCFDQYPPRLCVIDDDNSIAVDVETCMQYPYIRTFSSIYFYNEIEKNKIKIGKRFACRPYVLFNEDSLSTDLLKRKKEIINLLNQGVTFPDGNEELTNEEYLELINNKENIKVKKFGKKQK